MIRGCLTKYMLKWWFPYPYSYSKIVIVLTFKLFLVKKNIFFLKVYFTSIINFITQFQILSLHKKTLYFCVIFSLKRPALLLSMQSLSLMQQPFLQRLWERQSSEIKGKQEEMMQVWRTILGCVRKYEVREDVG